MTSEETQGSSEQAVSMSHKTHSIYHHMGRHMVAVQIRGRSPGSPQGCVISSRRCCCRTVPPSSFSHLCRLWAAAGLSTGQSERALEPEGQGITLLFPRKPGESPYLENRIPVGPIFPPQSLRLGQDKHNKQMYRDFQRSAHILGVIEQTEEEFKISTISIREF